ncbi:MAG TPA: Fe-S protein assembly co-chaperone HscB [Rhodocyclaceae bacterium]|jgi:molecular chaperone HscB|nr:Fe-S protein assembly co-chaperone HscB [Rhodocyclaceae bacterium]
MNAFNQDHFALFGLSQTFALDTALLEQRYREVQAKVHPDKHAHLPEPDKRQAMQWATRANEAYQTLKQPLNRARYLLQLAGHDPRIEDNTAMPVDFLMEQMELREAVADARVERNAELLEELHERLRRQIKAQQAALGDDLDVRQDFAAASDRVRQLMFQEKLLQEINDALEVADA